MPREPSNAETGFVEALHLLGDWAKYLNPAMPEWLAQTIAICSLVAFAILSLRLFRVILVPTCRAVILADGVIEKLSRRTHRRAVTWRRAIGARLEAKIKDLAKEE